MKKLFIIVLSFLFSFSTVQPNKFNKTRDPHLDYYSITIKNKTGEPVFITSIWTEKVNPGPKELKPCRCYGEVGSLHKPLAPNAQQELIISCNREYTPYNNCVSHCTKPAGPFRFLFNLFWCAIFTCRNESNEKISCPTDNLNDIRISCRAVAKERASTFYLSASKSYNIPVNSVVTIKGKDRIKISHKKSPG
jgi:hypothetical protein